MNYLFFDTEVAAIVNGVARICSFGYFLCDEHYNKIEKNDIIVNPRCEINSENLRKNGVVFAYPDEYFKKFGDFRANFDEIRRLLTLPDTLVIGHATSCDVSYILRNIRENNLSPFDFFYLDTQKLHSFVGGENSVSLSRLCEIYGVPLLTEHKSDDDAEMTAHAAERICKVGDFTLKDIAKNLSLLGMAHSGINHSNLSSAFPIGNGMIMTPHVRKVFRTYLASKQLNVTPKSNFAKLKFTFDEHFDRENFKTALWLVNELRLRGAVYTMNVLDCDIYVDFPSESENHGRKTIATNLHKKIIPSETLLRSLGIVLPPPDEIDTDKIFGSTEFGREWYEYYKNEIEKAP